MSVAKKAREGKEDRGQNIQVFARVRPINGTEKAARAYSVIDTPGHKELLLKGSNHNHTKTFQFDRVFGVQAEQLQVYRAVVEPLIEQVMMGYNCTVFAYGQTGSGKTFTMEGGALRAQALSWDKDPTSGVIPRALSQIFDKLDEATETEGAESTVKISFLELYNEEIFDLLSSTEDMTKLRLFDDVNRPGSTIIQGLEELTVKDKQEVYSILRKGSDKRKTAETLMNAQSSRSHTVFTVTVHIREMTRDGEEVLRIGKLNLVDLAGSENVGRSGAQGKMAREASNINQSLLTLGRVISSLVERAPHIPYRESKLTRLLQDSLGGRTKTSIIATVSPAVTNYEETLSTLDYAFRARNIMNKPEVNQKLSKSEVLKEYSSEMTRLRSQVDQIQEKNGVYLAQENWLSLVNTIQENELQQTALIEKLAGLEIEMERKKELFLEVETQMLTKSRQIEKVKVKLVVKEEKLEQVKEVLSGEVAEKEEQEHLVKSYMDSELKLTRQARQLSVVCTEGEQDLAKLHTKGETIATIQDGNKGAKEEFRASFDTAVGGVVADLGTWRRGQAEGCKELGERLTGELDRRQQLLLRLGEVVEQLALQMDQGVEELDKHLLQEVRRLGREAAEATSGLVNEKALELEAVGGEFSSSLVPVLVELVTALQAQTLGLQKMGDTVSQDLGDLTALASRHMTATTSSLKEVDRTVQELHSKRKKEAEGVAGACSKIGEAHGTFHTALKTLQAAHSEHESTMKEELPRAMMTSTSATTSDITLKSQEVVKVAEEQQEEMGSKTDEVSRKLRNSVDECHEQNKVEEGIVAKVEQISETFVTKNEAVMAAIQSKLVEEVKSKVKSLEEAGVKRSNVVEEDSRVLHGIKTNMSEQIAAAKSLDSEQAGQISGQLSEVAAKGEQGLQEARNGVAGLGRLTEEFLEENLAEYQPSGSTPVRQDRRYPHFLNRAEPAGRLLEQYRKEREQRRKAGHDSSRDSGVAASLVSEVEEGEGRDRANSQSSMATSLATSDWDKENSTEDEAMPRPAQPGSVKKEAARTPRKTGSLKRPEKKKVFGSSASINSVGK